MWCRRVCGKHWQPMVMRRKCGSPAENAVRLEQYARDLPWHSSSDRHGHPLVVLSTYRIHSGSAPPLHPLWITISSGWPGHVWHIARETTTDEGWPSCVCLCAGCISLKERVSAKKNGDRALPYCSDVTHPFLDMHHTHTHEFRQNDTLRRLGQGNEARPVVTQTFLVSSYGSVPMQRVRGFITVTLFLTTLYSLSVRRLTGAGCQGTQFHIAQHALVRSTSAKMLLTQSMVNVAIIVCADATQNILVCSQQVVPHHQFNMSVDSGCQA